MTCSVSIYCLIWVDQLWSQPDKIVASSISVGCNVSVTMLLQGSSAAMIQLLAKPPRSSFISNYATQLVVTATS